MTRRLTTFAVASVAAFLAAACGGESPDAGEASAAAPARPTPRYPDGVVRLDTPPGETKGHWGPASVSSLVEKGVQVAMDERGLLADVADAARVAPFRPWALALYEYRQRNGLADDPVRLCLSPAGPRHFHTPGGFRIIQDRNYDRVYVLFGGGNRNWRVIFMDGREPPNPEEVSGTYFGHSTGEWRGDTFVVEASGFNARFWFSNGGLPHTEALHLTERISRPDYDTLEYEVTIDDPLTYTRPWTAEWTVAWVEGEIEERFCEDHR
ncbi:MAG TPA: hypothetical protein VKA43_13865 [Gammaproteobacteria bacterium]|nr:hypothetical protein [Gammaproteobacteria bacterium]